MKTVSLHRELNTDQIYIYYSYCLKIYKKKKKKKTRKGEYFAIKRKKNIKKLIQKIFS